jgi:hypothetical protein
VVSIRQRPKGIALTEVPVHARLNDEVRIQRLDGLTELHRRVYELGSREAAHSELSKR